MIPDYLDLRHCDNMELMAQYPDKHFDLAIVDPPYNIVSEQARGVGSRIDVSGKMNGWNNIKPSEAFFKELFRVSQFQIIWGANNFTLPESEYFIIWDKFQTVENFASAEYAWTNCKMPAKVYRQSIHSHNSSKGEKIHPTMKPIQLYKWLLKNYAQCKECGGSGEVASNTVDCDVQTCRSCKRNPIKILDTHLGSMSIAIAVHEMNKQGMNLTLTGCELDEDYYNQAIKRVENACLQQTLFP